MGTSFSVRHRFPPALLLLGLISPYLLLLGCGGSESDPAAGPTPSTSSALAETTGPVLPHAPWFSLPDDWNEQHPVLSPNAKTEAHYGSLAERELVTSPADGGGRAWLEAVQAIDSDSGGSDWRRGEGPGEGARAIVLVSSAQRIEVVFEVGPLGIDEGGLLFIMAEPFWSWSEAQVVDPNALGFATAKAQRGDVDLIPLADGATFKVDGRALEPNERIDFVLGAGPRGIVVDEYADSASEILIAVDADGDGTRGWIKESAELDISARTGSAIIALGPAEVAPGDPIEVIISIVDARGNRARWPEPTGDDDRTTISFAVERTDGPALSALGLEDKISGVDIPDGPYRIRFDAPATPGTIRLAIRGRGAIEGLSSHVNPIVVRRSATRLIWADLHGHSGLSDGTGTPEDYFSYARDVARLDAVALTDHDHWGLRPLDETPALAATILEAARKFHQPERFVTVPGYEWTSWLHGHRHVLYFDEDAPIFSAVDFATDRPDELWDALRGRPALTFAHHSAGEPIATNWAFRPDPELEPVTEISSIHGMSEAADAPLPVYGAIPGNYIRDILLRGARLGFIGSGDSHDGHPGLAQLAAAGQSGLAGIFTTSLDRPGLLEAMRARRTFATNGIRPWLSVSIDETFMGGSFSASPEAETDHLLHIRYEGTAPIERVDLIRTGRIANLEGSGSLALDLERRIPRLAPGEFHYVRIIEAGGGVAWSSPIFVDAGAATIPDAAALEHAND